ncbi:MAG: hypothetical protein A2W91_16000 [Bacteroidetes bacterium GWF2_38_335]|nr:MAG: hypothetical protein A2W91_16000 [Bacteroidetes bacterium GWF2_38_335]OFY81193.1 MAG: hypothetical protein A2281_06975 [Bacteroidetes bacterium RIFOXYA12_FULL_38_20]HBS85308.1 hypothetical protein [Bacteroidales bacterium]
MSNGLKKQEEQTLLFFTTDQITFFVRSKSLSVHPLYNPGIKAWVILQFDMNVNFCFFSSSENI